MTKTQVSFAFLAVTVVYIIFGIILNSVGPVILQSINSFGISKSDASVLEGFKDIPIAIASFLLASLVTRFGYIKSLLGGLLLTSLGAIVVLGVSEFWAIKLFFACAGTAFALVKICLYAIIGEISDSKKHHTSLLTTAEGLFMVGVLSNYWIFSAFIDSSDSSSLTWLGFYVVILGLIIGASIILLLSPLGRIKKVSNPVNTITQYKTMFSLIKRPLVIVYIISIFIYVLMEQGIGTWLPTFNSEILGLNASLSIQITSIFVGMLALGRLIAGQVLKVLNWFALLMICIVSMGGILSVSMFAIGSEEQTILRTILPYVLPLVGFFMAPIYPILTSVVLRSMHKKLHALMTGLIIIFAALGGTTGSLLVGYAYEILGGERAFWVLFVPMVGISACFYVLNKLEDLG